MNLKIILFFTASLLLTDHSFAKKEQRTNLSTLDLVKKRGVLRCGVSQGLPGFSSPDKKGRWSGIDVDFCRAVAAAIFSDKNKVKFIALSAKERFTSLQSKDIDILSRNTTWTLSRDSLQGFDFPFVLYYDGQGFMVPKSLGVQSAKELGGAMICVNTGTTTELNVADYFRKHKMKYKIIAYEKTDEVVAAYSAGRCDVYTTDKSGLYANRLKLKDPNQHIILNELISKEPLGPAVRHGDNKWSDILRWTYYALLTAEEKNITSKNCAKIRRTSQDPEVKRLLGIKKANTGAYLGLAQDWAYQVILQLGNYGEIFERNLGSRTRLKIKRGLNALWNKGGLHYAMPVR